MNSLDTVTTVKKISFLFFLILGLGHFTAGGLFARNYFLPTSEILTKILFIPFILSSLAYAYGVIKEHLLFNGNDRKTIDYLFLTFGVLALVGLLLLQFVFPHV